MSEPIDPATGRPEPDAVRELLEAIRLTQEYVQLPPLEGWTWFDAYSRWRPADATRLYREWSGARGGALSTAGDEHRRPPDADGTYRRLAGSILVAHQRMDGGGGCLCGRLRLGEGWADHVAEILNTAGALRG